MDSEARAHVVDGQKQPGGLFLGRGLIPIIGVALGKKRGTHLQQQVLFVLVGRILNVDYARVARSKFSLMPKGHHFALQKQKTLRRTYTKEKTCT